MEFSSGVDSRKRPPPAVSKVAEAAAAAAALTPAAGAPTRFEADSSPSSSSAPSPVPMLTPPSVVKQPPTKKQAIESASSRDVGSKPYKGLRHFSMMVCKKVEEKGTTTYNEVADELVALVREERLREEPSVKFDEKNIRRRVYDALNVLMAMDIISKDKKAITWKGLPTSAHQDIEMLEREKEFRKAEIQRKREALKELLVQQVCFRNLVEHNLQRDGDLLDKSDNKVPLPFIVVNTHSSAVIQCNMSKDLTDVMFDFSMPFEINDDNTILKRLGMHKTSKSVLREIVPEDMYQYMETNKMLDTFLSSDENKAAGGQTDESAGAVHNYGYPESAQLHP